MNEAAFRAAEARMWSSVGVAPTERVVGGVRVQEAGEGPPVVLVHGASNSGVSWATLVRDLAGDHRCIAVDRPGCGLSAPGSFSVAALLDDLGLDRAHLLATSLGGRFALQTPAERIDRLVLFGWSVGAPVRSVPLVMRLGGSPRIGRLVAAMPVHERMVRPMLRRIGVANPSDDVVRTFTALLKHTPTMRNDQAASPRTLTLRGMDASALLGDDVLSAMTAPTLLLWGTDDPFGDAPIARAFSARLPDATLELLDGAGHAPWLDEPERCAAAVRAFLAAA